jgi:sucrose-6-phosphate hydrolase SacC (GH32 family)
MQDKVTNMESTHSQEIFSEKFRPQLHFTPIRNWINDPNGLLFYKGKYHLFYQHNPNGDLWGDMSWGHAVSTDLFHWNELPTAISYTEKEGIFSGSAVVDHNNTSGFGSVENPPLVAIYTVHQNDESNQSQHIAYSLDEGLTWVKYANNPVLDLGMKDFRDPKVFWDEQRQSWTMVVSKPLEFKIAFFTSLDLKNWSHLSDFGPLGATGGCWECPDLFPLTTPSGNKQWVLLVSLNPGGPTGGSGTQYFIGDWDGREFTPRQSQEAQWLDHGRDNYAGVTFSNTDNRRIFIGWMSNWEYASKIETSPWRGAMTLPRELSLSSNNGAFQLHLQPVGEFSKLHGEYVGASDNLELQEITAPIISSESLTVKVSDDKGRFIEFGYSAKKRSLFVDRYHAWFGEYQSNYQESSVDSGNFILQAIIDRGSIELSTESGKSLITSLHLLDGDFYNIEVINGDGSKIKRRRLFTTHS